MATRHFYELTATYRVEYDPSDMQSQRDGMREIDTMKSDLASAVPALVVTSRIVKERVKE